MEQEGSANRLGGQLLFSMTTLFVNACIRGEESRTLMLCREYLEGKPNVVKIDLERLCLRPLDKATLDYRIERQRAQDWDDGEDIEIRSR